MTDILISDYSSIAIDFMLTQRPVFSFAFDYDLYSQGRGHQYDLSQVFPTPLCLNFSMLENSLLQGLKHPETITESDKFKKSMTHFYNDFDGESTLRVIKKIKEVAKV
jgi:CDP-glycerol glycerophosphotransferase (TagB/SpsB family)